MPRKSNKQKKGFNADPITKYQRKNAKIGSVFIVPDSVFNPGGPASNQLKPRRAVVVGKRGGNMHLAPIRHQPPNRVPLSNFDGGREIRLEMTRIVPREKIYSKNHFPDTKNDYLTKKEKLQLRLAIQKMKNGSK